MALLEEIGLIIFMKNFQHILQTVTKKVIVEAILIAIKEVHKVKHIPKLPRSERVTRSSSSLISSGKNVVGSKRKS